MVRGTGDLSSHCKNITLSRLSVLSMVDQPKSEKCSRKTLTWHGLLIACNHARSTVHSMGEMVWVDATLDFEF